MLVDHVPTNTYYEIDMGRPELRDGDDSKPRWRKFFELVEGTDIPIVANRAYGMCRDIAFSDTRGYGGGGFKFCFAFESKDDRKQFVQEAFERTGMKYEAFREIYLYRGHLEPQHTLDIIKNKTPESAPKLLLAFSLKYMDAAVAYKTAESVDTLSLHVQERDNKPYHGVAEAAPPVLVALKNHLNIIHLDMD